VNAEEAQDEDQLQHVMNTAVKLSVPEKVDELREWPSDFCFSRRFFFCKVRKQDESSIGSALGHWI
jgi:hypothetical protein